MARLDPSAVIGLFPSDHVILDEKRFRDDIRRAAELAAQGANIVVIGVKPTRAETGYGYIEAGREAQKGVLQVKRFTEKPTANVAEQFVKAGNFFWNSGMFIWGARTLADALSEHLPKTAPLLKEIADSYGTRKFEKTFARLYPKCENISVDYAVLEPRSAKGEVEVRHLLHPCRLWLERSWDRGPRFTNIATPATMMRPTSSQQSRASR